jgi:hypothetical protein
LVADSLAQIQIVIANLLLSWIFRGERCAVSNFAQTAAW